MKRKISIALCMIFVIAACNKDRSEVNPSQQTPITSSIPHLAKRDTTGSLFISTDTANRMIESYITSLATPQNTNGENLKSFSINADSLRAYLANGEIKNIKIVFAHTQEYINSGNYGKFSGLQSGAMTIIVAGYDASGNYIYLGGNVLDHAVPCPYACPPGNAGMDILN